MPIPETPNTREEMYLNAMATGDSGGIPPVPYTRQEMYLDAIARNGGGGGSGGGVLVVHDVDGTLDKTWQEIHDAVVSVCVDSLGYIGYAMFVGGDPSQDMYGVEYVFHTDDGTPVISVYVADDPDANPHLMNGGGGEV